ncbi:50S ribosomal protein L6 [Buchnera aphidicola (Hormaphis cornu)]|nr:50S ribosomal protein L6 [Buchnera aphidicola (Hormaphis cornu)]
MSRVAKRPIYVPENIDFILKNQNVIVIGKQEKLCSYINKKVDVKFYNRFVTFEGRTQYLDSWVHAGTARSLVNSMIIGVTQGFCKKLYLSGVGYRVTLKNINLLQLSLGFSHVVQFQLPLGVYAEIKSSTELILKSANKQLLGQVAANIRGLKKPEPYKGKGIRYENEVIRIKEAKKK